MSTTPTEPEEAPTMTITTAAATAPANKLTAAEKKALKALDIITDAGLAYAFLGAATNVPSQTIQRKIGQSLIRLGELEMVPGTDDCVRRPLPAEPAPAAPLGDTAAKVLAFAPKAEPEAPKAERKPRKAGSKGLVPTANQAAALRMLLDGPRPVADLKATKARPAVLASNRWAEMADEGTIEITDAGRAAIA